MQNHRKIANDIRIQQGLPPLPIGSKYTAPFNFYLGDEDSHLVNGSMPGRNGSTNHAENERLNFVDTTMDPDPGEDEEHPPTPIPYFQSLQSQNESDADQEYIFNQEPFVTDAYQAIDDSDGSDSDSQLRSDGLGIDADDLSSIDEAGEIGVFIEGSEGTQRLLSKQKFISWARENKKWVDLSIDFAAKQVLMTRILDNLQAPYKNWITVFRNIVKYSPLHVVEYLSCKQHMLFEDCVISTARPFYSFQPKCLHCEASSSIPRYSIFRYISILSRVKAWMKSEQTFGMLFHGPNRDETGNIVPSSCNELRDYYDGTFYRTFVEGNRSQHQSTFDIFLAVSTDGFDVFSNRRYDCWPVVAHVLNLDPIFRTAASNVVPLGFVGGPTQPKDLASFMKPMVREINSINSGGGTEVELYDKTKSRVRVHVLRMTADLQALPKFSGHLGPSAKQPCLCCDVPTVLLKSSNRYYLPSLIRELQSASTTRRVFRTKRQFEPRNVYPRSAEISRRTLRRLSSSSISERAKKALSLDTGLKGRTIIHELSTFKPFEFFPIDTMHLGMNITKDLLDIFRGTNRHLLRTPDYPDAEEVVISTAAWEMIDSEIEALSGTTPYASFGPPPRKSCHIGSWKASECRQFVLSFWLVLFDGHLPRKLMKGLRLFTQVLDLWSRPVLTTSDVDLLRECCVGFYMHFEKEYYKYEPDRIGLCKLTMHMLLHVHEQTKAHGPLVNCSQFWVEKYIGYVKSRLNARAKASESLSSNAIMLEGYKLFYGQHFQTSSASPLLEHPMRSPSKMISLQAAILMRFNLRSLLISYISSSEGLSRSDAHAAVYEDDLIQHSGFAMRCGEDVVVVGCKLFAGARRKKTRADYYISAEYKVESSTNETSFASQFDVYYGRVLAIFEYTFLLRGNQVKRQLFLADWASNMKVMETSQVYSDKSSDRCFSDATVSDICAITSLIGLLEHEYPRQGNYSHRQGRKTFFLDNARDANHLLEDGNPATDGTIKTLRGMHGEGAQRHRI